VGNLGRLLLLAVLFFLINAAVIVGWRWLNKWDSYDACVVEGMKDKPSYMAKEVFDECAKARHR
jgi:hypothetical protein